MAETLIFNIEWFDELAAVNKPFKLVFWPQEGAVQIVDLKSQKLFLKKIKCPDVEGSQLVLGNKLKIYGRTFMVTDYGDSATKAIFVQSESLGFLLVKPDG